MCWRLLLSVLTLILSCQSYAASLLRDVVYSSDSESAVARLDIQLGVSAVLMEQDLARDGREVTLKLTGDDAADAAWSSMRVVFEEEDRFLRSVTMEGSSAKGFELRMEFTEAVAVTLLPQFSQQALSVKFAQQRWYKKHRRFPDPAEDDAFTVVLESRPMQPPTLRDIPRRFAQDHKVYLLSDSAQRHQQLRLGFFTSQGEAQRVANALRREFPDANLVRASQAEVQFAGVFQLNPADLVAAVSGQTPGKPVAARQSDGTPDNSPVEREVSLSIQQVTPSSLKAEPEPVVPVAAVPWRRRVEADPDEVDLILKDARQAFASDDYNQAIVLFTKALDSSNLEQRREALEYLGVAREMNGQEAQAKRIYEEFLTEFPQSDEATQRVQQRMAVLIALDTTPESPAAKRSLRRNEGWGLVGQLGQFYRRHTLEVDGNSSVPVNGLFNDLNLMARHRGGALEQEARVTMSYLADFSGDLDGREFQVSHLSWEGYLPATQTGLVVGRQTRPDSGVLGQFDGVALTQGLWEPLTLAVTGGFVAESTYDSPDSDRPFFGIAAEYVSNSGNLAIEPFFIQQYVDNDIIDRQAIGAQTQLRFDRGMVFSLVDYDLNYSVLNNFTLSGDVDLRGTRFFGSFEHRRSPYLTTRNALIGQPSETLTELEQILLDLDLEDVAADRTAKNTTLRFGVNQVLSEQWTLTADVTASDYSETQESANVLGIESNQTLYSSLQLRSIDPFGAASYSSMTLRRADSGTSTTTSLFMDNRVSFSDRWRVYPRLRIDYRSMDRNGDTQWSARPSLRLDYRRGRRLQLEFEAGYDWTRREMTTRDLDITGTYIRAGYRALF